MMQPLMSLVLFLAQSGFDSFVHDADELIACLIKLINISPMTAK